jgi:1-acyl-sn-glycerol-3-phosphate acyltransferase
MNAPMPESPPIPWRFSALGVWRSGKLIGVMIVGVFGFFLKPSNRGSLAQRALWLQRNCQRCLRALNVTVVQKGALPKGALLTPNHVSYLDIIVLSSLAPTVFVSKSEVGGWPIFGWFAKRAGTRFLRRDLKADLVRVGDELKPVIEAGINLVIFLEGTSTDGREVRAFKPSLLEPAVRGGWPVAPATIRYELKDGNDPSITVAWWGTMPLAQHLLILAGLGSIKTTIEFGEEQAAEGDRKSLAQKLHSEVSRRLMLKTDTR